MVTKKGKATNDLEPLQCVCSKTYKTEGGLIRHLERKIPRDHWGSIMKVDGKFTCTNDYRPTDSEILVRVDQLLRAKRKCESGSVGAMCLHCHFYLLKTCSGCPYHKFNEQCERCWE